MDKRDASELNVTADGEPVSSAGDTPIGARESEAARPAEASERPAGVEERRSLPAAANLTLIREEPRVEAEEPRGPTIDGNSFSARGARREQSRERTARAQARPAAAPKAPGRAGRLAMLIGGLAFAAAIGSAAGSIGYAQMSKVADKPEPPQKPFALAAAAPGVVSSDEVKALRDQIGQLRGNLKSLGDQINTIKTSVETSGKAANGQLKQLAEALERAEKQGAEPATKIAKLAEGIERFERSEKQQAELATKLSKVVEAIDRIEKKSSAGDVTGSVGRQASAGGNDSIISAEPREGRGDARSDRERRVISSWIVRRVNGGLALLEGPEGLFEIEPGETLPGGGKVEEIRRQNGKWMVITSRGVILSR